MRLFTQVMRPLVCLALLMLPPITVAEDGAVRGWLAKMTHAVRHLNYQGNYIYLRDNKVESSRLLHSRRADGSEYEKIISLNGSAREIHRNNDVLTCYLPDQRSVIVDNRQSQNPFVRTSQWNLDVLGALYHFKHVGAERVAGRSCQRIDITPRDHYRYGYQLCLDTANGMLLSAAVVGSQQKIVEQMLFTDIEYPEQIPAAALKPETNTAGFVWQRHNRKSGVKSASKALAAWQINQVPIGFNMAMQRPQLLADRVVHQHIVYSDGVASVSVFVERLKAGQKPLRGVTMKGATHVFGRVVNNHQVTVMGDVPRRTVMEIGQSIQYRQ